MIPLLSLQDVSVGYMDKPVVRKISFTLAAGEFCALLGRNGSGKTTLLKAICGLLPMKSGRCLANGHDCTRLHEYQRAKYISYIPQRHSKLQGVDVLDVVLMGLNARLSALEQPSAADKALALEVLKKVEAGHLAGKIFSQLSEGQKQLVILARSLLQDAPVMLMDEPDSSLDFINSCRMVGEIRRLIHGEGKAGLVTLHDPNLALTYCDRLLLLHDGTIASGLSLSGASRDDVRGCLSTIYGDISVLEHEGKYVVFA